MSQKPKPKSKPAAQKQKPKAALTHITILGETIDIAFNMAVELNYEEISGEAFTIDALAKMKNSIALYMAAILAANPDTTITVDRLLKEAKGPEIAALSTAVITAMTEWMQIPSVITDKEQPDTEEEPKDDDAPKN